MPDLEAELAAASDAEAEQARLQTGANTRDENLIAICACFAVYACGDVLL